MRHNQPKPTTRAAAAKQDKAYFDARDKIFADAESALNAGLSASGLHLDPLSRDCVHDVLTEEGKPFTAKTVYGKTAPVMVCKFKTDDGRTFFTENTRDANGTSLNGEMFIDILPSSLPAPLQEVDRQFTRLQKELDALEAKHSRATVVGTLKPRAFAG